MFLDQLVCGVHDLRLQRQLLAHKDLTLQSALDEARAYEMAEKYAAIIQCSNGEVPDKAVTIYYEDSDQSESSEAEEMKWATSS